MRKISKKQISFLIIAFTIAAVYGLKLWKQSSQTSSKNVMAVKTKGDPRASIKIVEYVDLECPSCAKGSKYLDQFMKDHPGKIYLQIKYFPLTMHQHGFTSAKYAECTARQEKFWPFVDLVFERQKEWSILHNARPAFDQIAKEINLNMGQLERCLDDKSVDDVVMANAREGKALDVKSTPSYFVNGKMVVGIKYLEAELNRLLEENKN